MENRSIIPDDILSCKICYYSYNKTDRKPLILTCGHTFCKDTISKLINEKQQNAIECPICKTITPCNVPEDMIVNYELLEMIPDRNRPFA